MDIILEISRIIVAAMRLSDAATDPNVDADEGEPKP